MHDNLINPAAALPCLPCHLTAEMLEVAENPLPRCPVILLLDCSDSLAGAPIEELQRGLGQFISEMRADIKCRQSVELAIVTFGGEAAELALPFTSLSRLRDQEIPALRAAGLTPLGGALQIALSELEARRFWYQRNGLSNYRGWLVLMTDGCPNDDFADAVGRLQAKTAADELLLFIIAIGPQADMVFLNSIAQKRRPPKRLDGLHFRELFAWVLDSLRIVVASATSDRPRLPSTEEWSC